MPSERFAKKGAPDPRAEAGDEAVVTKLSPWSMADTVARLSAVVAARGMEVLAIIDLSAQARDVGLDLRDTKLVIFGSPSAATAVIKARRAGSAAASCRVGGRASDAAELSGTRGGRTPARPRWRPGGRASQCRYGHRRGHRPLMTLRFGSYDA